MADANWTELVAEYEDLIGNTYLDENGEKYTFLGLLHGKDDYYFVMYRDGKTQMLSCVGHIEQLGLFRPDGPPGGVSNVSNRIEKAKEQFRAAAESLMAAIRQEYPLGSVVSVTIGNATFDAEIVCHSGDWWCSPEELQGRNLKTGKVRTFTPANINGCATA